MLGCVPLAVAFAVSIAAAVASRNVDDGAYFYPKRIAFGAEPEFPATSNADSTMRISLSQTTPCATLDYGFEVAGQPVLQVASLENGAPVEVETKYAESFSSLSQPLSDGPFSWSAPLTNTHRVETFRFTEAGESVTSLTQGGQRWQTVCLVDGAGVSFERVGFRATVPVIDDLASELPGGFASSDSTYDAIWALGARAATAACIPAASQPRIWTVIDAVNGTLVPGTRPGLAYTTWNLTNYELRFETQIVRGGIGVTLGASMKGNAGIQLHLAAEYPASSTFSNANKSLFPPSTVKLATGSDFVNVTTALSYDLATFSVPFNVSEREWLQVVVEVDSTAHRLALTLNGTLIFNVTLSELPNASHISSLAVTGAIGFGGWQDQRAFVRNLLVTSRVTGKTLYENTMTDADRVLPEFGQQTNAYAACLDGAKRDRYVWLGDFYHTSRILGATSSVGSDSDTVTSSSVMTQQVANHGTWGYIFNHQAASGQFVVEIPIGYPEPPLMPEAFASASFPDYGELGLLAFVSYMEQTGDVALARAHWAALKSAVAFIVSYIQADSGLVNFGASGYRLTFTGSNSGAAVNCLAVQVFRGMSRIATAVDDPEASADWTAQASALADAINVQLWNEELGVYVESAPDSFGLVGLAFAITSGVANESRALASVAAADSTLRQGPGYLDFSSYDATNKISPNFNGYMLDALLCMKQTDPAKFLLESLWGAMLNDEYSSGASWEYVGQDLAPGLGGFTSLSHPWGGAATYALTKYVAGIRPVELGYKTWQVAPIVQGFGLTYVTSRVDTPYGPLAVAWELSEDATVLIVNITSPAGTSGILTVDQPSANETFTKQITGGASTIISVAL